MNRDSDKNYTGKILRFSLDCEETAGNNVWKHRSEGPTDGGNLKWSGLGTTKRVEQTRAEEYCKLVGGNAWMNNRKRGKEKCSQSLTPTFVRTKKKTYVNTVVTS